MSGTGFIAASRRIKTEKHRRRLGTARIKLDLLDFPNSRGLDQDNLDRLKRLFRGERGCKPEEPEHRIPAVVDEERFREALHLSGVSSEVLLSGGPEFPRLDFPAGFRLECLRGHHRARAAQEVFRSGDKCWVVELFAAGAWPEKESYVPWIELTSIDITDETTRDLAENYINERKLDDGEFYYKIREYQGNFGVENPYFERIWWARLASTSKSTNKKDRLEQLFAHRKFAPAFDAFRHLKALYGGLRLSVLNKIISMGCDDVSMFLFDAP